MVKLLDGQRGRGNRRGSGEDDCALLETDDQAIRDRQAEADGMRDQNDGATLRERTAQGVDEVPSRGRVDGGSEASAQLDRWSTHSTSSSKSTAADE